MEKTNEKKKIIITGGGTLGHILPILPVVFSIYNEYDLYFIGTIKGKEKSYFKKNNIIRYFKKIYYVDMIGINRKKIYKNFVTIIKYIKSSYEIKKILGKIKPDLVIGMGGYISGVVIKQAIKKDIKTIIHEQNAIMGFANKLVYKKVNKVLLTYEIKDLNIKNKCLIGNPRLNYVKKTYKTSDKNIILIFGGSLGSVFLNNLIINNIDYFNIQFYNIYLVVGDKYYVDNQSKIKKIEKDYTFIKIYNFLDNIIDIMKDSSLIICRSGASTISEILGLRKPTIFIPSPNVTSNHQYYNALDLYNKGCCEMIEEKNLTKEKLYDLIKQILTTYSYKQGIITNINKYYNNNSLNDFINVIKKKILKN